mmetsp:Transcript_3354/g.7931  ORF Transcript_3354/g.7931 Transcript_3354/m.7931 type:complete len:226 (+) Transcript_3354:617-1294(+)
MGWQREGHASHHELQVRQRAQVRAIAAQRSPFLEGILHLPQGLPWRNDEGGTAVHDGLTRPLAAAKRRPFLDAAGGPHGTESNVLELRGPEHVVLHLDGAEHVHWPALRCHIMPHQSPRTAAGTPQADGVAPEIEVGSDASRRLGVLRKLDVVVCNLLLRLGDHPTSREKVLHFLLHLCGIFQCHLQRAVWWTKAKDCLEVAQRKDGHVCAVDLPEDLALGLHCA